MPWTTPTTRASGYKVTAANWNELVNDLAFLAEVAYVEFTADVSITATTVGTANQIVSAGAVTLEAVPHMIEFFCARYIPPAVATHVILRDGTTVLGTLTDVLASSDHGEKHLARRLTPTAASHTYNVAAWNGAAGTGTMKAGTGGAAGDGTTYLPGFIRVTRLPT
jgi:hypothetical protein